MRPCTAHVRVPQGYRYPPTTQLSIVDAVGHRRRWPPFCQLPAGLMRDFINFGQNCPNCTEWCRLQPCPNGVRHRCLSVVLWCFYRGLRTVYHRFVKNVLNRTTVYRSTLCRTSSVHQGFMRESVRVYAVLSIISHILHCTNGVRQRACSSVPPVIMRQSVSVLHGLVYFILYPTVYGRCTPSGACRCRLRGVRSVGTKRCKPRTEA